jgi:hypothetical protein
VHHADDVGALLRQLVTQTLGMPAGGRIPDGSPVCACSVRALRLVTSQTPTRNCEPAVNGPVGSVLRSNRIPAAVCPAIVDAPSFSP